MSHSLLRSRQVGIILSVPVHLEGSNQAAKAHVHKVSDVSEETTAEREKKITIISILQGNREGFLSKEELRTLDQFFSRFGQLGGLQLRQIAISIDTKID